MTTRLAPEASGFDQTPLQAAWRFRWLVLLLTILGGVAAYVFASGTAVTEYEATASLVVTDPRTNTLFSADQATRNADRYVEDQIAILGSDSVAQRSHDRLAASGIEIDPLEIAEKTNVLATTGNEIQILYLAADETTAISAVNAVVSAYEEVRREAAVQDSASAIEQLDRSIASINDEISIIEAKIDFIRAASVQSDLDEQYEQILARIVVVQPRLLTTSGEALDEVRAELDDLDLQLARLTGIAGIEDDPPELVRLYDEQAEAVARRGSIAQQRDQLVVDTELLSGGISLSSPAQFAMPTAGNTTALTVFGAMLGALAGLALAQFLAQRRRRFTEKAEPGWVLETSMLAEIPAFGAEGIRSELPVLDSPSSASAEAFRFASTALEIDKRRSGDPSDPSTKSNTFFVTSPDPQEGKTVFTANLALAAAAKGRRVLAIDADFGNQRLSELLRGEDLDGPGITEIVEADVDIAAATYHMKEPSSLDVISRGSRHTSAPDFFSLSATTAFLEKVGEMYDLVVIDGPPMLHAAYASIIAEHVDRVIVLVRHGGSVTRIEDLHQRLDLIGTPLAGYVYYGTPLRSAMTLTEGSLKDVLGEPAPGEKRDAKR